MKNDMISSSHNAHITNDIFGSVFFDQLIDLLFETGCLDLAGVESGHALQVAPEGSDDEEKETCEVKRDFHRYGILIIDFLLEKIKNINITGDGIFWMPHG